MFLHLAQVCVVGTAVLLLRLSYWLVNLLFIQPRTDPMRHLPGPKGTLLQSHLDYVMDPEVSSENHKDWRTRFGQTFRLHGFGRHDLRLMSFDLRVVTHVLSTSGYEKPWQTRAFLGRLIGRGIFSMEGSAHTMQRRIIAPAFTHQSVKQMTPVFFKKADELAEKWKDIISEKWKTTEVTTPPRVANVIIDVAHWISRASFDVIGLAGFNYDFHALTDESEKVYGAYRRMFNIADKRLGLWQVLELYFPILRKIWVDADIRTTNESLRIISESGKAIVAEKKLAYQAAQVDGTEGKDLLSLLIKSNLSETSRRLTDQELLDQCSTFLLAGSDSVSVALSWCLHFLSLNPDIQNRLRKEINTVRLAFDDYLSDSASEASVDSGFHDSTPKTLWDSIENLRYLDFVVRETLRFCPPVHATIRVATEDDCIPINHPITTSDGKTMHKGPEGYVKIRKGTYIHIPIEGLSHSEDIWGEDALVFNPDRWADVTEWDPNKPGILSLMTFGYGPQSCLGYRFSIAEMKCFIATLLPQFEFRPAEDVKIGKFNTIITRPYVSGKWSEGTQLPISICEFK